MSTVRVHRKPRVGLWLDQSGATIVTLRYDEDPVVQHVDSNVESNYRRSGGCKSGTQPQDIFNEKRIDRRRQHQLDRYYERLSKLLGDAEHVLVMGPGEAKLGLERLLSEQQRSKPRRKTFKTADRMTERQLVATVKRFFSGE